VSSVDLAGIEVQSGVNEQGVGFCHVIATSTKGDILMGQLEPDRVRQMALDWLGAAEAADQDAVVFRLLRDDFDLDFGAIGAFITKMRQEREE